MRLLAKFVKRIITTGRARQARVWAQAVEQAIPSKPLVGAHQRMALKHAQLAAEIGWTGPRR